MIKIYSFSRRNEDLSKQNQKSLPAFTLVETIVSTGIIIMAIMGPLSVAINSSTFARDSRNQIAGTFLAQEAVELLRFYRDTVFLKCTSESASCAAIQVSTGNYESPSETSWRIFKTNLSGASGASCMVSNNPAGCAYDIMTFLANPDAVPTLFSATDNTNCRYLVRDDRKQNNLAGDISTSGVYLCAINGSLFTKTVFSRFVNITSIPAVNTNNYDIMYNDDLRVETTVIYSKPTGFSKRVKIVDFIRARV